MNNSLKLKRNGNENECIPNKKRNIDVQNQKHLDGQGTSVHQQRNPQQQYHMRPFQPRLLSATNISINVEKEFGYNQKESVDCQCLGHERQDPLDILGLVFPDLNIKDISKLSPGADIQSMANFVIEKPERFPQNPSLPIEFFEDQLEPTFISLDMDSHRASDFRTKLLDAFCEDFREYIGTHFSRPHKIVYDKECCNRLLHQHFPYCRTPLIEHLIEEFAGRFSTSAWFCFFIESKMAHMIRQYFHHIEPAIWTIFSTPMHQRRKRRTNWIPDPVEGPMANSIHEFYSALRRFRSDYKQLFYHDRDRILPFNLIPDMDDVKEFECLVCTGQFPMSRAISCNSTSNEIVDFAGPSTSKLRLDDHPHYFCVECLIGHARAATQEMPLAEGGIGLQCMASNCKNPILFSECRSYIPPNVRRQLNSRIIEENLGAAKLENLERCKKCTYAMIIEASANEYRVFSCMKCGAEHCRKCNRPWNKMHIGKACHEMLTEQEKLNAFEIKLSEAIIRRCHRCSLPFVKIEGCNRMQCRCGATQCYLCRAVNINYPHFCQHLRVPGQKNCRQCKKQCLLWQPAEEVDNRALSVVHQEAKESGIVITEAPI